MIASIDWTTSLLMSLRVGERLLGQRPDRAFDGFLASIVLGLNSFSAGNRTR